MNFFKLYIGDYQRDTAHLSIAEHGAYMLMLQHYYATEKPLPTGKALHRMLRAQDRAERDAIDLVAEQFWTTTDAGLVNERADAEIAKARTQADTNARIAREREDKRKASRQEHESCTNRATNDQPNHSQKRKPPNPPAAVAAGFVEFWQAWPRKVSKGDAEKAWSKVRPDGILLAQILSAIGENLRKNEQWKRDGGQYIPHPATWLNRRGWEDELSALEASDNRWTEVQL